MSSPQPSLSILYAAPAPRLPPFSQPAAYPVRLPYNTHMNKWLRALAIVLMVIIVIYGVIAINLYSSVGRFPTKVPRPPGHITSLIWPTIGFPELVNAGSPVQAEFLDDGTAKSPTFTATLRPVRAELRGLAYTLGASALTKGTSRYWPVGTRHARQQVWRPSFTLPEAAVPELYDLTIDADIGGRHVSDAQPHAVSVLPPGQHKDFTFVSLSDIHVHQRNISGALTPQSNKGIAPDGTPVFFEKAIDQVNLLRPDFAVMLGDYVRAQRYAGEYQPEFANFYKALSRFEVPVFIVAGNHDVYFNEVDGAKVYEENIGPLHYSFDAGEAHFTAVNTNQWPASDRIVMEKFGTFVYPRKWQGQVLGAADERKTAEYRSQLAWIRDDLARHQGAAARFMLMHHDPYRPNGKAIAWKNERFGAAFTLGGGGLGSTALKELASMYRVGYVLTGHWHSDYVGSIPWTTHSGDAVFANQTMVTFDEGGMKDSYPGYRMWSVQGGSVSGYTYLDDYHSIPLYDGSSLNGMTDLDRLDRPAISVARGMGMQPVPAFYLDSYLGVPIEARGIVGAFPARSTYKVTNGEIYQRVPMPGYSGLEVLYIKATAPAGKPGSSAGTPGEASRTLVIVE
jgi:3',5'-cyclic AMP phosphodiesterase CpdA